MVRCLRHVIDRLDGKAQHIEDGRQVDLYVGRPCNLLDAQ